MTPSNNSGSFVVNRTDDSTWHLLMSFMAENAVSNGRSFTSEHERAVREMLHYDIPRDITDASRIEQWIYDNAANTISKFRLFQLP